jgi:type II secretory pathway pseudopilin PulG
MEIVIVLAMIALIIAAIFPAMGQYKSRGRDVSRIANVKDLSANFQNYARSNSNYPNNTNQTGATSYCVSDVFTWHDAPPGFPDRLYTQLWGTKALLKDPELANTRIGLCTLMGSYLYARLQGEWEYAVLAARMELQTTWANYANTTNLTNSGYIDDMVQSRPLDKNGNDVDKIFLIITN